MNEAKLSQTKVAKMPLVMMTFGLMFLASGASLADEHSKSDRSRGATCTITTQPSSGSIVAGQSISFVGRVSGRSPYRYSWRFSGGSPSHATTRAVAVRYDTAGTYRATLDGRDRRGRSCSAGVSIRVAQSGNQAPQAQAESYSLNQDQSLNIAAPGVLANDSDADGDALTAVLVSGTSQGSLTLNANGSFSYAPNAGFSGQDSFGYQVRDSAGATSAAVTVTIQVQLLNAVSINSSSSNAGVVPAAPVLEQAIDSNGRYRLLAINDLGMHCGDLDTRISSILPPFNVVHAQVVERGVTPRVMGEGEVSLVYSAASNANDPALTLSPQLAKNGGLYKTSFWEIALAAYDAFYPQGVLPGFYAANAGDNVDLGLPVPDVERFYLGDGQLTASQQAMPGLSSPYLLNEPQAFNEHLGTLPFFTSFPFGYTADLNLFEAAGVPISVYDDSGRQNPYPLMRVQARVAGNVVDTLDTVLPISGEAQCQTCHSSQVDGGNGSAVKRLADNGVDVAASIEDPSADVPTAASVEWASDLNILRLHDLKHGTHLDQGYDAATGKANKPVVCQTCHYTPALDLAQLGPLGPENDQNFNGGSLANGRDQVKHQTMSNVMHGHHADVAGLDGQKLFPEMPPAVDAQGNKRDPLLTQKVLGQTCYSCHPGKNTQCMRGAMANGGLVCQDCHGNMSQVGNDFSKDVSPANPGNFHLGSDFYKNMATLRVPWANEPGCGSCHTGNAMDNLAGGSDVLTNPEDSSGNPDGIRLLQAYRQGDTKATPIVPGNKQFAENVVAEGRASDGNPKLYRVSTGHGGLMCEGCHGATHAEWPNANPLANDNIAATQIQGHTGTVAECTACHEASAFADSGKYRLSMKGPHGMHAVDSSYWNKHHKEARSGDNCRTCHGNDGLGTVLSRTSTARVFNVECERGKMCTGSKQATFPKGHMVGCSDCHSNKINSSGD